MNKALFCIILALTSIFDVVFGVQLYGTALAQSQQPAKKQRNETRHRASSGTVTSSKARVSLSDSENLLKVYPFRPTNDFYVSGFLTFPVRTHPQTNGIGSVFGLRRGLFDFYLGALSETRVWRQLEQRPNEDSMKGFREEFTAEEVDPSKVTRNLNRFRWSASDPFSLWSIDAGFGVRFPAPFLPESFSSHISTFISVGNLTDKRATLVEYSTRGAGILFLGLWKTNFAKQLHLRGGFRYSLLEASPNNFTDVWEQLSVQTLGFVSGVEWFL